MLTYTHARIFTPKDTRTHSICTSTFERQTIDHYYINDFAQRCTFVLRGGHLFLPAAVNPTIYCGGHFLFTAASTFACHGKSIYRGGRLKMSATENNVEAQLTQTEAQ